VYLDTIKLTVFIAVKMIIHFIVVEDLERWELGQGILIPGWMKWDRNLPFAP